jgi:hypothetical protein
VAACGSGTSTVHASPSLAAGRLTSPALFPAGADEVEEVEKPSRRGLAFERLYSRAHDRAFDLLELDSGDLRAPPLVGRQAALAKLIKRPMAAVLGTRSRPRGGSFPNLQAKPLKTINIYRFILSVAQNSLRATLKID